MNNKKPDLTAKEWELMQDYMLNASRQPRMNLISLIDKVDPEVARLGMNSGPYIAMDRLMSDELVDFACHMDLRKPIYLEELSRRSGKSIEETARLVEELGGSEVIIKEIGY